MSEVGNDKNIQYFSNEIYKLKTNLSLLQENIKKIIDLNKELEDNKVDIRLLQENINKFKGLKNEIIDIVDKLKNNLYTQPEILDRASILNKKLIIANNILRLCKTVKDNFIISDSDYNYSIQYKELNDTCLKLICDNSNSSTDFYKNLENYVHLKYDTKDVMQEIKSLFSQFNKDVRIINECNMDLLNSLKNIKIDDIKLFKKISNQISKINFDLNCNNFKLSPYVEICNYVNEIMNDYSPLNIMKEDINKVINDMVAFINKYNEKINIMKNLLRSDKSYLEESNNEFQEHKQNLMKEFNNPIGDINLFKIYEFLKYSQNKLSEIMNSLKLEDIEICIYNNVKKNMNLYEIIEKVKSECSCNDDVELLKRIIKLNKNRLLVIKSE